VQPLFAFLGQERATPAQVRLGLQRTVLPKLLAHPAHRRYAKTEKLGNLASALAAFIELKNPPTHRDRYGSHGHILCHTIAFLRSYIIYGNALGMLEQVRQNLEKANEKVYGTGKVLCFHDGQPAAEKEKEMTAYK